MRNWLFNNQNVKLVILLNNQNAGKMENWLFIIKLDNLLFTGSK